MTAPGALRCSASSRAVCAAGAVARFRATAMLARANKPCSVCLGSKLDRADAMRGRLRVIQAAEPTVFRYCCARGMKIPPAAPAKKLQRFETLRLLWRRDSVCSGVSLQSVVPADVLAGARSRTLAQMIPSMRRANLAVSAAPESWTEKVCLERTS